MLRRSPRIQESVLFLLLAAGCIGMRTYYDHIWCYVFFYAKSRMFHLVLLFSFENIDCQVFAEPLGKSLAFPDRNRWRCKKRNTKTTHWHFLRWNQVLTTPKSPCGLLWVKLSPLLNLKVASSSIWFDRIVSPSGETAVWAVSTWIWVTLASCRDGTWSWRLIPNISTWIVMARTASLSMARFFVEEIPR